MKNEVRIIDIAVINTTTARTDFTPSRELTVFLIEEKSIGLVQI